MRDYEITVLLRGDLDEKKVESWVKSFESLLEKSSAKLKSKTSVTKKPLAYEINKLRECHYVYLETEMDPTTVAKFEPNLKNDPAVLRYLIINKN